MCSVVLFMSILLLNLTIHSVNSLPPAGHSHHVFRNNTRNDNSGNIAFPDEIEHIHFIEHSRRNHEHGEHYNFNHHNKQPETVSDTITDEDNSINKTLEIPLDFINDINYLNISDVIKNYVEDSDRPTTAFFQSRFGEGDEITEKNSAISAKSAACIPELQTIKLITDDDPSVLYIPQCTRVERCGGCCSHRLLSCQPTENGIETITYQVMKTKYTGGKKLKFMGKEGIPVEKHTKCKCSCKVKAEDCNIFQEYRKNECRCICTNRDEEKKCEKENKIKLWNPETCSCECRNTLQCSTGYKFDFNECRCVVGRRNIGRQ